MRLIGYARTSTVAQETSLADQGEKFRAYCSVYGHTLVDVVVGSESAKSLRRDKLQRALAMLRENKADGLLVLNLSRLCRNVADSQLLLREYFVPGSIYGKALVSLQDYISTDTAAGMMLLNLHFVLAQFERDQCSERTKAALAFMKRNGERVGQTPYGWDATPSGRLRKNAEEQRVIAMMRRWRKAGWSYRRISQRLHELSIKPKNRGARWHIGSIVRILKRIA